MLFRRSRDHNTDIRILVTSRDYPADIFWALRGISQIHIEARDVDIARFLSLAIDDCPITDMIDDELKKQIIKTIIRQAQHLYVVSRPYLFILLMSRFLLPSLHIRTISSATTAEEIDCYDPYFYKIARNNN